MHVYARVLLLLMFIAVVVIVIIIIQRVYFFNIPIYMHLLIGDNFVAVALSARGHCVCVFRYYYFVGGTMFPWRIVR